MNQATATIIKVSESCTSAPAAAARISTGAGNALEAFSKGGDREKDIRLIGKVLGSGHLTIAEHAYFTVAFNDVSVLCEQLMIEHRLASYTVKSRRYVDFTGAGFVMPEGADADFSAQMTSLFEIYAALLEMGIPREDARFVLPYCMRSNFILSCNARELAHIVCAMTEGYLSVYPELKTLGQSLKEQLDAYFPGITDAEKKQLRPCRPVEAISQIGKARETGCGVTLVSAGGKEAFDRLHLDLKTLVRSDRPRELELLNYVFDINGISLSCLTHFTRHRMLTLLTPRAEQALMRNAHIVPETVRQNPDAYALYAKAFESAEAFARGILRGKPALLPYCALSGNTVDITVAMNARELLHFLRLRTCTRAQWEIRGAANEMLCQLMDDEPALFKYYGPGCAVLGYCPEGRLSCGKAVKPKD